MFKRSRLFMCVALCLAVMFGGCAKDDETNGLLPTEFDKKGTLQGFVFNAITGQLFSDYSDLKMTLIQGTTRRTPDVLISDPADQAFGSYAFSDIPVNLYSNNKIYQIKISKPGYQDFFADFTFMANANLGGAVSFETTRIDNTYNILGNVYLFPIGTNAGDINIRVTTPSGELVNGATVRLQQNIAGNNPYAEIDATFPSNSLTASAGYMTSFSATTNSSGIATFNDSALVLGGSYTYRVDPITFNNQQLTQTSAAAVNIVMGVNNVNQTIALTALTTPADPTLYVDIASNSVPGTITASGVLTLTFNQAVSLSTGFESTLFTGTLSGSSGAIFDTTFDTAATATVSKVAAALDTTGKVLTITPKFTTNATAAGATIAYTYAGSIYIKNTQAIVGGGFAGLTDKYSAGISSTVRLTAW